MKRADKTLAKLATTLPSTTDILRGSLLQRRIRHRSGCAVCARGGGHLISVLTVSYPRGRTKQIRDRKSTRLNSLHQIHSYSAFCFEKKTSHIAPPQQTP